jgi:hypothetical protein
MIMIPKSVEVFYSYAHEDEKFLVELVKHLAIHAVWAG